jgi:hypothetical protein
MAPVDGSMPAEKANGKVFSLSSHAARSSEWCALVVGLKGRRQSETVAGTKVANKETDKVRPTDGCSPVSRAAVWISAGSRREDGAGSLLDQFERSDQRGAVAGVEPDVIALCRTRLQTDRLANYEATASPSVSRMVWVVWDLKVDLVRAVAV